MKRLLVLWSLAALAAPLVAQQPAAAPAPAPKQVALVNDGPRTIVLEV